MTYYYFLWSRFGHSNPKKYMNLSLLPALSVQFESTSTCYHLRAASNHSLLTKEITNLKNVNTSFSSMQTHLVATGAW